jgi:hypothetical protein
MRDHFNNEIFEGCIIAYPVRSGSSLWIEEARVIGFTDEGLKIVKADGKKTRLKNTHNCFVCHAPSTPKDEWNEA